GDRGVAAQQRGQVQLPLAATLHADGDQSPTAAQQPYVVAQVLRPDRVEDDVGATERLHPCHPVLAVDVNVVAQGVVGAVVEAVRDLLVRSCGRDHDGAELVGV